MLHVGRRKHVGALAAGDAVLQQPRCAKREAHAHARFAAFERLRHFGQRSAQAAGGKHAHFCPVSLCACAATPATASTIAAAAMRDFTPCPPRAGRHQ